MEFQPGDIVELAALRGTVLIRDDTGCVIDTICPGEPCLVLYHPFNYPVHVMVLTMRGAVRMAWQGHLQLKKMP